MRNLHLPTALGLFRSEDEIGFIPHHEVHTDLKRVLIWDDFDEWVGRELDLVDDQELWALEFLNIIPSDFMLNIANQADLDEAVNDVLFKVVEYINRLMGLKNYGFFDPLVSNVGIGDFDFGFFKKNSNRPSFLVQTMSPWDSPELSNVKILDANYIRAIHGYLKLNHVEFGVITSYTYTRFVRLVDSQTIMISEPYSWNREHGHTTIAGFVALSMYVGSMVYDRDASMEFLPVSDRKGKVRGSVRYDMRRNLAKKESAQVGKYITRGEFSRNQTTSPVFVKCFNEYSSDQFNWEMEVYTRIEKSQGALFPSCLVGNIWEMVNVIILKNEGKPLTKAAMRNIPSLGHKMLAPVKKLHELNLVHGDIKLRNFVVDSRLNVKLTSLGHCVYTGALKPKINELHKVRNLVRGGLLTHRRKKKKCWRKHKRRLFNYGWARYKGDYVKLREGSFVKAIKKDRFT